MSAFLLYHASSGTARQLVMINQAVALDGAAPGRADFGAPNLPIDEKSAEWRKSDSPTSAPGVRVRAMCLSSWKIRAICTG